MNKKFLLIFLSILSIAGYGVFVFAAPPSPGGYNPGQILDPDCTPGQSIANGDPYDCFVVSPVVSANNGLTVIGNNVQLGGPLAQSTVVDINGHSLFIQNNGTNIYSANSSGNQYTGFDNSSYGTVSGATIGIINSSGSKSANLSYGFNDGTNRGLGFSVDQNVISMSSSSGSGYIGSAIYIENPNNILKFSGSNNDNTLHSIWQNTDESDLSGNTHANLATLYNNGNWSWYMYQSNRDDSGVSTPINFLYTDSSGNLLSAPTSLLGGSPISVNGTTLYSSGLSGTGNYNNNNIFFGSSAGDGATNASYSNFLGYSAGYGATSAYNSNFLGYFAGDGAYNASYSNFFGSNAGNGATDAFNSNFFGNGAGYGATSAYNSNFLGYFAGDGAYNASYSNFFGSNAGQSASSAYDSNFFGQYAGSGATNASNSIFIGKLAGQNDTVNNTGNSNDFSILLGPSTSTGGYSNSIAIGGSATNTASNQFMIGSTVQPISSTVWILDGFGASATLNTSGVITTSDERLKTITSDLSTDTLDKLVNIKTVNFTWKNDSSTQPKNNIGFLAQDLQQYFPELVYETGTGYYGVNYANMTPILVEAIREMNLKITTINDMETGNVWRDAIVAWLGNVENGIAELFAKRIITDELCLSDENGTTCYTRSQLDSFINTGNSEVFIQNGSLENETPINNPNSGDINQTNINLETGDGTNEQNTENQTPESQSNVETTITQVDIETNIDPALIDTVNK